jgi:uncharacterized iron-regulated membrane protein
MTHSASVNPLQAAWRVLRALLGLAVLAGMLLLGLAVATGLVAWALIRGRRLQSVRNTWPRGMRPVWRGAQPPHHTATGEVVDAQVVREVIVRSR